MHLQPQKTKFPTNSALSVALLTAKSATCTCWKINTIKIDINQNIWDSYASGIKFVGPMTRDFKKRDDPIKNGTSGHPNLHYSDPNYYYWVVIQSIPSTAAIC
jgi:hypothetical protein